MCYLSKFVCTTGLAFLLLLQMGGNCRGADSRETGAVPDGQLIEPPPSGEGGYTVAPEPLPAAAEVHVISAASAGYRFISVNRFPGNAAEYDYLHSGPVLGGQFNYLGRDTKFVIDGVYLNEKDFHGDLTYDYMGRYRMNLRSESLFHNLDHAQLFPTAFTLGANSYTPVDRNPGELYGVRSEQDLARFRYKFSLFPIHLNLGYWHMSRKGAAQQIFADQAFEGTPNSVYSITRQVDRHTHEGQFGLDTHLGLVDIIYEYRIRVFGEQNDAPRDPFVARLSPRDVVQRNGGLLEHNENPDSRIASHTIRLHTSLSGGVVGAASYTYARRENRSVLSDFRGGDQVSNTIQNIAGDFSYTPCHFYSLALKYRRQEIDRSGPGELTSPAAIVVNPPVAVRPAPDSRKDVLTASMMFRLTPLTTLKGEYRGEFLSRENIDSWLQPGKVSTMGFPERSETHTGSVALLGRPFKGAKFRAEYRYSISNKPEYANGIGERHEGTAQLSYNAPNRWGVSANGRISRDNSDTTTITTLDLSAPSQVYQMPRNRKVANAIVSLWLVPVDKLTVTGSYSLLRTSTDQAVLFASPTPGSNTLSNYTSQAQIYAVNAVYRLDDRLDVSLALQQVRSSAEFSPQATAGVDSTGITDISRIDTVENSISARADYRFYGNYSCSLEYQYRDYDNRSTQPAVVNGSVNSVMLHLAAKW